MKLQSYKFLQRNLLPVFMGATLAATCSTPRTITQPQKQVAQNVAPSLDEKIECLALDTEVEGSHDGSTAWTEVSKQYGDETVTLFPSYVGGASVTVTVENSYEDAPWKSLTLYSDEGVVSSVQIDTHNEAVPSYVMFGSSDAADALFNDVINDFVDDSCNLQMYATPRKSQVSTNIQQVAEDMVAYLP